MKDNKILWALMSIVAALILWTYVVTVENPEFEDDFYNIPVVIIGENIMQERGLMVIDGTNQTVSMRLKGNRSDLNNLKSSDITVKVDLSKIDEAGVQQVDYTYSFPGNIASNAIIVESKSPDRLTMTFARRVTKNVAVNVVLSGAVPQDFIADEDTLVTDVQTIKIIGPEDAVNQISQARINVNLDGRTESFSEDYSYTLCNEAGEGVDVTMVSVDNPRVNVTMRIQKVKDIPLVLTVISGGGATEQTSQIHIDPQTIKVSGSDNVLDNLNELNIGTINLGEITGETELTFPIVLPDNVINRSAVTDAKVTVSFPDLLKKTFTVPGTNIQCVNVPEGLEAEIITQSLKLDLRGPKVLVNAMSTNEFVLRVDFTGKQAGTFTMQVDVDMNNGFEEVGVIGTCTVTATLRVPKEATE